MYCGARIRRNTFRSVDAALIDQPVLSAVLALWPVTNLAMLGMMINIGPAADLARGALGNSHLTLFDSRNSLVLGERVAIFFDPNSFSSRARLLLASLDIASIECENRSGPSNGKEEQTG